MRRASFLDVMLTVNATLMACLLWVLVAQQPLLSSQAAAQSITRPPGVTPTIPNAGAQRAEMLRELKAMRVAVEDTNALLASGRVKVAVTNLGEVRVDRD